MDRRQSPRVRTDAPAELHDGPLSSSARLLDVSTSGALVFRRRAVLRTDHTALLQLELSLPERHQPLRVVARSVWYSGHHQALRFLKMSDVDRLNLAEHVDLKLRRNG